MKEKELLLSRVERSQIAEYFGRMRPHSLDEIKSFLEFLQKVEGRTMADDEIDRLTNDLLRLIRNEEMTRGGK